MAGRRKFTRAGRTRRTKRLAILATEGEKTERVYYQAIKARLGRDSDIVIHVEASRTGSSDPASVLRRLKEAVKARDADKNDVCWVIVDRDTWPKAALDAVANECAQRGFGFGISNPSFELWLTLHLPEEKTPTTVGKCIAELQRQLGAYSKSEYDVEALLDRLDDARRRAKRILDDDDGVVPTVPGTRLHLLSRALQD